MRLGALLITSLLLCFVTSTSHAQLPPVKNDPLAKSSSSAQACSATEASCAEAAAKIIPQVMGPSPMGENLRRLTDEIGGRVTGSPEMAKAVDWAVAAFRAAGVEVHTEKYTLATTWSEGNTRLELLGPEKFAVRLVSEGWSPATPAAGIEANLIDVGFGTPDDLRQSGCFGQRLHPARIHRDRLDLERPLQRVRAASGHHRSCAERRSRRHSLDGRPRAAPPLPPHKCWRWPDRRHPASRSRTRRRHTSGAHYRGLPRESARAPHDAQQDRRPHRTTQRHRRNSRPRKARRVRDPRRTSGFLGTRHRRAGQWLQCRAGDRGGSRHPGHGPRSAPHHPLRPIQRGRARHGRIMAVRGGAPRRDG